MVDVRMPDGVVVRFPDDMPRDQIRDMIATKFPQVAQQQQAQAKVAPVPMPLPSFRQGNQEIIPPMPRPRPMPGVGPGGNQRTYEIQAPDGRKITIRAADEQTAIRGAQEWVAANPISQPAASAPPQGQQPASGGQITINIGGQRVKVGNEFLQMSPEMQNQTVDEIAAQIGVRPNGVSAPPPAGFQLNQPGMSGQPQGIGGTNPLQIRLDQIGAALQKADAAGNSADAQALANAYRQVQAQMGQQPPGGQMKKFEVKTPDGQTFEVTAPDMESASASIQEYLAGANGGQQPSPVGPSQEWLRQNPDLANLPIPGTTSPNGQPAPSQGPQPRTGAFENATAGLNNALYSVAGFPVDAANTALRIGAAGINAATGSDIQLPENTMGGRQSIADAFGQVGVTDPANVVPANNFERSLRAGGEGAGYAVAPELVFAQLSKLGIVGAKAQQLMGQIFGEAKTVGGTTGNMVAGATGGMGAQMAADAVPEEWKGAAAVGGGLTGAGVGTLVTQLPRLAGAGGRAIGDFLKPFTQGGREVLAGRELRQGASSPGTVIEAVANAPTELVPGSKSTAFQMSGDMGLGAMERAAAAKNPAEFMQRRADQNSARIGAIEGMQPTGAPEAIVSAVRSHIKQIDDELEAAVAGAARTAQGKVSALGQGAAPDIAGGNIRNSLETARAAAKARERALWDAVDPDGTLALSTGTTKAQTARIIKEMPASAKPPEGEEAAIMGAVRQFGDTMPFSEITALQGRIKTQMRTERIANGESPAYRRLTQLNGAIQQDLETAIAGKVQQQARAVQAGEMSFEQTIAGNIQKWQNDWRARQSQEAVGFDNSGIGLPGAGGRAPGFGGLSGTAGQGSVGFRGTPGNPGLSPNAGQPNFDRAALDRLTTARQATKQRAETFDNSTLGPIRRRPGTTSPYDMPVSAVPAQIFNSSPKSVDVLRTYRAAVGDGPALTQLQDFAIDRLRKVALREDGTFDPARVAAWRRAHADVLQSFPQLNASLADAAKASETLASVAAARDAARTETQRGILGRMMGLNSPEDVTRAVGSIFGRQDSQNLMMKLVMAMGKNPEAKEGLRKAVVDYILGRFVGNTESATSGMGTIKSDQLQTFINQNKGALRIAGFGDDELKVLDNLAEDLQRANRSLASVRLPGGSNTAQDVIAARLGKDGSVLMKIILASLVGGGGVGIMTNSITGLAATVGAGVVGAMRQKGIQTVGDLVKDALLNPDRAAYLMMKASPGNLKLMGPSMIQKYRRAALASIAASATP